MVVDTVVDEEDEVADVVVVAAAIPVRTRLPWVVIVAGND